MIAQIDTRARVDHFVTLLLERAAPLRFARAESIAEREAIFRLRYEVVITSGWARPEEFADDMEQDAYDDDAIQIAGWDGDMLACTTRLVLPVSGRLQPTEAAFGLVLEPRGQIMDCGRVIVSPRYRTHRHLILWALLGQVWREMRAEGFDQVCGIFSAPIISLYERMGFRVRVLAPGKKLWGEERFPCMLEVLDSIDEMERIAAMV
jgi:N-acyl-L-homoserine lactone synthetase